MIICSISTIPDRYWSLLKILEHLKKQTIKPDVILITISKFYPRIKKKYDPYAIDILQTYLNRYSIETHIIENEIDIGPTVKLLTPLKYSTNDDDIIIITDDDTLMYQKSIEIMLNCYNKGGFGIYGLMGILNGKYIHGENLKDFPEDYIDVDLLGGYRGVMYPLKVIGDKQRFYDWINMFVEEHTKHNIIAMHDDHIFCYFSKKYNIPRRVCAIKEDGWFYNPIDNENGIFKDYYSDASLKLTQEILKNNNLEYLI